MSTLAQIDSRATVPVHFAHANGFPAGSYASLFRAMQPQINVLALEKFGHNPQFPVDRHWADQAEELVHFLSQQATGPVYAAGHSFGAVISYIAACQRPDLIKGLIMLDPPLITGFTRVMARTLKKTPLFDRMTPARLARTRCTEWPPGTDMVAYFQSKALFRDIRFECIEDYVKAATESDKSGIRLAFDHQVEASIFETVPLDIHRYFGQLKVPGLLVTGRQSKVCLPRMIKPFLRYNHLQHKRIEGGHMFPLEHPQAVAELIKHQILQWETDACSQE